MEEGGHLIGKGQGLGARTPGCLKSDGLRWMQISNIYQLLSPEMTPFLWVQFPSLQNGNKG